MRIAALRAGFRRREQGFALLLVLWGLILLGLIAASFLREARVSIALARNATENANAEALADAGVQRAMLGLLDPDPATAWRADGRVYRFALGEGSITVRIQDEAGKIDLVHAPAAMLASLFEAVGADLETAHRLADAILDYADRDSDRRPGGAEDSDYVAAGRKDGAKDGPFERKEELMKVLGMTPALYKAVAPYVTVYSGRSDVNLSTAPDIVLRTIPNLTAHELDQIKSARSAEAAPDVSRVDAASIHAEAVTSGGGRFVREAVVRRSDSHDDPFELLEWRHAWQMPSP